MKKLNDWKHCCGAIALALWSAVGTADGVTQINRYATVDNKPLAAQVNPLLAVQQVHFGTNIKTVGEALNHWLLFSGYNLVADIDRPDALKTILAKPLPQVDRDLGPLSVQDGLEVLVGKGIFNLVIDPLNRTVGFKLSPRYAALNKKVGGRV